MRKRMFAIGFVALTLFAATPVAFAMGETPGEKQVSIGDTRFAIPSDLRVRYDDNAKAIRFIVDAGTLKVVRSNESNPDTERKIEVFVVEDGNDPYGRPPFASDLPEREAYFGCRSNEAHDRKFEFCQYEVGRELIDLWGTDIYVLREQETKNPILLVGCDAPSKGINPLCEGRGLMLGNIRLRYTYSVGNLSNAFHIDQAIREIVVNFYNRARETGDVVHTNSD